MKTFRMWLLGGMLALVALPALALDLQQARTQGLVGEQLSGYVSIVTPSPEVNQLVAEVNTKRRAEYARISKENGQPIDVVGKVAAQKIIENLPAGAMFQGVDGSWKKR